MKTKINLLLISLLIGGLVANAQISKNSWYLNGLNLVSFQTGTEKDPFENGSTSFSFFAIGPSMSGNLRLVSNSPQINYCFTNNLSAGIFLNLDILGGGGENTTLVFAGPDVRYFILNNQKFLPFVEAKLGFGSLNYSGGGTSNLFGWYIGTGASHFFTSNLGLDLTVGFDWLREKESADKWDISSFQLGLGLIVKFNSGQSK